MLFCRRGKVFRNKIVSISEGQTQNPNRQYNYSNKSRLKGGSKMLEQGKKIKIIHNKQKSSVKIIKVLEVFPNGNGFAKVEFPNGSIQTVALQR